MSQQTRELQSRDKVKKTRASRRRRQALSAERKNHLPGFSRVEALIDELPRGGGQRGSSLIYRGLEGMLAVEKNAKKKGEFGEGEARIRAYTVDRRLSLSGTQRLLRSIRPSRQQAQTPLMRFLVRFSHHARPCRRYCKVVDAAAQAVQNR